MNDAILDLLKSLRGEIFISLMGLSPPGVDTIFKENLIMILLTANDQNPKPNILPAVVWPDLTPPARRYFTAHPDVAFNLLL